MRRNGRTFTNVSLLFLLLGSLLAGCSQSGTGTETSGEANEQGLAKELQFYAWAGALPDTVIQQFEKEFGVDVTYSPFTSNEEMMAKLHVGENAGGYDLIIATNYAVEMLADQGMLLPLNKENIPNMKNIGTQYLDTAFDPGNQYSLPAEEGHVVLTYNPDKVTVPLESFQDLWKPELKNSLVVPDDQRTLIGIANVALGGDVDAKDPAYLEKSKEHLIKLLPNIKAYASADAQTLLINNEASAGVMWSNEAYLGKVENPNLKVVLPKEPLLMYVESYIIPKNAPHKETAEAFINFLLRPEVSAEIANLTGATSTNTAAYELIDPALREDPGIYPPGEKVKTGVFAGDLGEAAVLYDRIWAEFKNQ